MKTNVLYYGDNLDILRQGYIDQESVDLIYLDPPFNSNASYNVIFKDESGNSTDAQIEAFDDTWHWGPDAEEKYLYLTNTAYHQSRVPSPVSDLIDAFHSGIKPSPMLAYIVEMAVRLVELHRVLKPTGSLYLHCDPTASHYLKLLLDAIFGPQRFLNEITWKRTTAHNDPKRFGRITDRLLYYSKTAAKTFNRVGGAFSTEQLGRYKYADDHGPYRAENLTAPHYSPTRTVEWLGVHPGADRQWRFSSDELDRLYADGRILLQKDGRPRKDGYKVYLSEAGSPALQDLWADIALSPTAGERLGYPTQKPIALLERIIESSSNPGDIVLDPFCGCGTALIAAQGLIPPRRWIGIDVTYLAIAVMEARLRDTFGIEVQIEGSPTEVAGALKLAHQLPNGREQFELWALTLVGAMPQGGIQKRGADKGVDGIISFTGAGWKTEICIVSVKSGGVGSGQVDELKGAMQRHGAVMGLFVTLEEPSKPMLQNAAEAGYYHSELSGKDYPAIQIITIRELLEGGKKPSMPLLVLPAYQKAQPVKKGAAQSELFG